MKFLQLIHTRIDFNSAKGKASICGGLFCIAFLIYANTLSHGFVFDDQAVVNNNRYVQKGIEGLPEIFSTGSWSGFNPDRNLHIYRPLQLAVFALQYEVFGLNPAGYHIVHVFSYAILCCFSYLLLFNLFRGQAFGPQIAAIAALLFTIHPVHTEVVANIKGNGDLLSMLFSIAALHFIFAYSQNRKPVTLALSTFSFLIALFFKETAVTTVGIAGLILYFFSECKLKTICLSLIPLLLAILSYLWVRSLIFGEGANSLDSTTTDISNVILMADGWSQEIGLRLYALGKNLQLTLFPYPLLFMYVYDTIPMIEAYQIESLFPLVLYVSLVIFFLTQLPKRTIIGFSVGFYLITIFLFSNILISIPNIISERWLLMPSLGMCIALGSLLVWIYRQHRTASIALIFLLCFGYSGYTIQRNFAWASNLSLAQTDIRTAPTNYNVLRMMSSELHREAIRNDMSRELLRESAHYTEQTLRITPHDYKRRNRLGNIYEALGDYDLAALAFANVTRYDSDLKDKARYSHAKNLNLSGNYLHGLRVLVKLEMDYPKHAGVKEMKATALKVLGKEDRARETFAEVLRLDPQNAVAHRYFARYYLELAKGKKLDENLLKKSAYHHEFWLAHSDAKEQLEKGYNALGQIYEQLKEHSKAAKAFGIAAKTKSPIRGKARFSEAKNMSMSQNYEGALPLWQSLEDDYPANVDVQIQKAEALDALQQTDAAKQTYRTIIKLIEERDDPTKYASVLKKAKEHLSE